MKIVFLNVWGDSMQEGLLPYLEEQARDTDIFCFQEATDEMKHHCADVLSGYKEVCDYKYLSDKDNFPQSMFIKKDIDVLTSGTLMASEMDRGLAIYAKVKINGVPTYVCNVHGTAHPKNKLDSPVRLEQSSEIINFFKDKKEPVVIGGDFNIFPETESIEVFALHGYRNLIKDFAIETTRNRLAWDRFPVKMLYSDYVFINDKIKCQSFIVPQNEISDHLPMLLEIEV
ncbi:MAG: endonuclease/exonuclease/phosphatase family protein [Candidatus Saccharimonadales bacterium]